MANILPFFLAYFFAPFVRSRVCSFGGSLVRTVGKLVVHAFVIRSLVPSVVRLLARLCGLSVGRFRQFLVFVCSFVVFLGTLWGYSAMDSIPYRESGVVSSRFPLEPCQQC